MTLRAYAVGARFSTEDLADQFAWRPTDPQWSDVEYRRPRGATQPTSGSGGRQRRPRSAVESRVDPSRIRTPEQQRAAGQRVCNS